MFKPNVWLRLSCYYSLTEDRLFLMMDCANVLARTSSRYYYSLLQKPLLRKYRQLSLTDGQPPVGPRLLPNMAALKTRCKDQMPERSPDQEGAVICIGIQISKQIKNVQAVVLKQYRTSKSAVTLNIRLIAALPVFSIATRL